MEKEVTVMFSDIRDYTSLAEQMNLRIKGEVKKAESAFHFQSEPYFRSWWDGLNEDERVELQAVVQKQTSNLATLNRIQRNGLVTAKNDCFSVAFASWIRESQR